MKKTSADLTDGAVAPRIMDWSFSIYKRIRAIFFYFFAAPTKANKEPFGSLIVFPNRSGLHWERQDVLSQSPHSVMPVIPFGFTAVLRVFCFVTIVSISSLTNFFWSALVSFSSRYAYVAEEPSVSKLIVKSSSVIWIS